MNRLVGAAHTGNQAARRIAVTVILLLGAVMLVLSPSANAAAIAVTPAGGAVFPQRSLLVSGADIPGLRASDVHIVENGVSVEGLTLRLLKQSSGRALGVVVVIDVYPSVASIKHAATIAQDISSLRPPQQAFGLIEADNVPPLVLPLTRNAAAIGTAFARRPTVSFNGLHLWNAALTGVNLLARSKISAGSVVVVSDGADRGDPATLNQLVAAAAAARVHIFTIGIPSPYFFAPILRDMALRTGGQFYKAAFSHLRQVFDMIESRLTNEYLITYDSLQPPGRNIAASIHISGIPGTFGISYASPHSAAAIRPTHQTKSFWTSSAASLTAALSVAVLVAIGMATILFQRGPRASVRNRIAKFLPSEAQDDQEVETAPITNVVFERAQHALEGAKWWPAFQEEVDIAQIPRSAIEIVFLTLVGSALFGAILFVATGLVVVGILPLLLGPVAMRVVVHHLVQRQRRTFEQQLGEHLQEIASAMRAGRSLVDALALVTEEAAEPTRREFSRALADERLGVPLEEALAPIGRRMDNDDMAQVVLVAALDRSTGASTAEVLERLSDTVREHAEIRRELHTLTAQARLSRWILTALPIFLLIIISIGDPTYERPLFHTTFGIALLVLSAVMVVAGSLVMSRLIRIEL